MKGIIISCGIALMVWGVVFVAVGFNNKGLLNSVVQRTAMVVIAKEDTIKSFSSGVVIGGRYVITTSHTYPRRFEGFKIIVLVNAKEYEAKPVLIEGGVDGLMLLELNRDTGLKWIKIGKNYPLQKAIFCGHTAHIPFLIQTMEISRIINKEDLINLDVRYIFYKQILLLNSPVAYGFSGGGLWDKNMKLIGIVWGGFRDDGGYFVGMAVPAAEIYNFILRWKISADKKDEHQIDY